MSINPISTRLMPISQALSWYAIFNCQTKESPTLYNTLMIASSFYCLWALYKVFVEGNKQELGHYSMAMTALATTLKSKYGTLGALSVVVINFVVPIIGFGLLQMPAKKLAKAVKGTDSKEAIVWAFIFKGYMISSTLFWTFALYQVSQINA
mmetsp:Transcript_12259/g.16042  ORF Transcript_12259/g.16042 Transcript_12259/m.16042 type:complete len:152 (-) Transcript_12259:291-746(-)|eukprot:CAMPEP_0198143194 /NCGR_PEP_ID=MMETSP1443-20131203/6002_1 /TAXON_ID=186043 /ORGANISM="Entomoneis sp., Strain CCMP2396" /LENGTH=151 /DNA_ID=CAMNT_0043806379 /DNA_START=100 /DNA_END=555 /DNA_ORIENTATION=+